MYFLNRAKIICFNKNVFKREISYLSNLFLKNGYPSKFFDQSLKKFHDRSKLGAQKLKTDFSRSINIRQIILPICYSSYLSRQKEI